MREDIFISFAIGFLAASPGGPMGLLCMRRTMIQGFLAGLYSALGIALAYLFWSYVALHGLGAVSHWIERQQRPLQISIGLLLVGYGVLALFRRPTNRLCRKAPSSARERDIVSSGKDGEAGDIAFIVDTAGRSQTEEGPIEARSSFTTQPYTPAPNKGRWAGFASTFLVVFLNPATLLVLTLLFTYFGIAKRHSGTLDALAIASSVFIGAITFWMAVSYSIHKARNRITDGVFQQISHLSAFGIMAFGLMMFMCAV